MAEENVEIVRRVYEAEARRDSAAVLALYDPSLEWDHTHSPVRDVMGGPQGYRGHRGLRAWSREWYEAWDNVEADALDLFDVGDQVVSDLTYHGRGRASGAEVDIRLAGLWTIRDGRVVRVAWFETPDQAREAARAEA